jgi:hypothetical protein
MTLEMRDHLNRGKPCMVTELSQYPRWACNGFRNPCKRDRQGDKWLVIAMKPYLSEGKGSSLLSLSINESEGVLMLPAQVIRRLEALGEISKQGKRLKHTGTLPGRSQLKR